MTSEILVYLVSYLLPFLALLINRNWSGSHFFILLATGTSLGIELLNLTPFLEKENNLRFINIYEYLGVSIEIGFVIYLKLFSRRLNILWIGILSFYIVWHALFNMIFGFNKLSSALSFCNSFIGSIILAISLISLLSKESSCFDSMKNLLKPLMGFFIYEAASILPLLAINLKFTEEELRSVVIIIQISLMGSTIVKNLLFSWYIVGYKK